MHIEIINPQKALFSGEAVVVQFPGKEGSFEVMENHAPLIAVLKKGRVRIVAPDKKEAFVEVEGGLVEVKDNVVMVLAE
ncbi:MAG: ATP synthase F1 subunit epsilon [Bacteroidales bacterium]|nr:ATP synthase F1 subunit epsilon [Bacteroidales bacterium]